ncbi:hypothetical protein [Brevibacillus migulae]|uniref:hypothetical protein n=1 Tax=Brevibacillus migulae TaxID=1644114 RepID=UPI00106E56C7|nr:hypothetical protein [Brevibacillus migulae]
MARLEYRKLDEANHFPVLYYYDHIDKDEISLRFACDYFVKGREVYEKTSTAIEPHAYVIYVKRSEEEQAVTYTDAAGLRWGRVQIEVREYRENTAHYPLVHLYQFTEDDDALLLLQSDYITLGGKEWEKTSTEVDEDRKVYVYYAKPTG